MTAFVTQPAPSFSSMALVNGEFKQISLEQFKGKKVVLFFYPLDFTFVCPTEILALSDAMDEFEKRDTAVLGCSVDSHFSHLAWASIDRKDGGIKGVRFPILADINKTIARDYNVLLPGGVALRGLFIINKDGVLKHMTVNHNDLGRNVEEVLRVVDAIDFSEEHGEVCPANWHKGDKAMKANASSLKEYVAGKAAR